MIGVLSSAFKQAQSSSQKPANVKKVITLKSGAKRQISVAANPKVSQSVTSVKERLNIKGKPISMNFDLMLDDSPNPLPVSTCFEAMRGHGRRHTTRKFEPFKAYQLQEGDLAIAYKGARDNPTGQVIIRVGRQYRLNKEMLQDTEFQNKWAEREKHAPETLPKLFTEQINSGKEVWGMTFEPVGDLVEGKILDFATGEELEEFKSTNASKSAQSKENSDISKSIQHLGTLENDTQSAILEHLNTMKSNLNQDVSQYAQGRQNFWLGTRWNLKEKQFESSGTWNSKLWELCKRVYPDADMALITYSGDEASAGISLHRDDLYAAFEARSISIESLSGQVTKWQMQQTYPGMNWVKKQNSNSPLTDFKLPSGSMIAFNCKNPHAALPGKGRWSINLWQVSNKQRENYNAHIENHGIHGGAVDLGMKLSDIPLPEAIHITPASRASYSAPPELLEEATIKLGSASNQILPKSSGNPLSNIQPKNQQVAHHMKKDLAMAEVATQFIGFPVQMNGKSSTEKYLFAWGDRANTGVYTANDIVMVSGNGPWRAEKESLEQVFEQKYIPLLTKAIAAKAKIVIGSAKGTDLLVQNYLKSQGYALTESGRGYISASAMVRDLSQSNQSVSQIVPVTVKQPQKVSMISVPNLDSKSDFTTATNKIKSSEQAELKDRVNAALTGVVEKTRLLDTVKVWQTKNNEVCNSNSVIANFNDAPSSEELNYRAALIGRETGQKAVISFRESVNDTDALISLNVPNHHDEYAIRAKLEEVGIENYSLIPTPKFTKVVISDRGGINLPSAERLAKQYGTILRITQGKSSAIPEREFNRIIKSFEKANRRDGHKGNGDRHDSGVEQPQHRVRPRNRSVIAPRLKKSEVPVSPATQQSELRAEAIPILRDLLNLTPGKRNFTNGEIVVKYDSKSKTLSLVDLESSQLKLRAIHNGRSWQSDANQIGGLNKQDISLLKAALVIARDCSHSVESEEKSAFASLVNEPINRETKEHQASPVER